jgi:hypothetical protein
MRQCNSLISCRDDLHSLCWLPHKFPPNVYILISTTPGPYAAFFSSLLLNRTNQTHSLTLSLSFSYLKTLQSRNWPILEVEPLTTEERKTLIEEYLAQYGKRLTPQQLQRYDILSCSLFESC